MSKNISRKREQFTTTVKPELIDKIRNISDQTDIPISKLLDRAMELLIDDMINKGQYKSDQNK